MLTILHYPLTEKLADCMAIVSFSCDTALGVCDRADNDCNLPSCLGVVLRENCA